jgi:membrane protein DedA with SNARE-associated domain
LGVPIAAAPVLMVVGAASVDGILDPVLAVGSVAVGALLTESAWFGLARWRGRRLLDVACGLASNPNVCALSFRNRVRKSGAGILIAAKFIPGSGSVPAFAQSVSNHFAWVGVGVTILFITAFAWRVQKARRHRAMHVKHAAPRQDVEAAAPHAPFPLRQAQG